MEEIWKPIPGFPGYEVSSLGRVKSFRRKSPRILSSTLFNGYPGVSLGAGNFRRVHRLVMLSFVGPCPSGQEVCHNDGNRTNNRLDNLRYDTRQGNALDKFLHKTAKCKLTLAQAVEVKELYLKGATGKFLASKYGVSIATITSIIQGESYTLAGGKVARPPHLLKSPEQVRQLRENYFLNRTPLAELSKKYKVTIFHLSRLLRGKKALEAGGPIKGRDY